MDTRAAKETLRAELKVRRTALTARELQVAGDAAARLITQLPPEWKQAETVCLYASFGGELPTDALLALALLEGKRLPLPRDEQDHADAPRSHGPRRAPPFPPRHPRAAPLRAAATLADAGLIPRPGPGLRRSRPSPRLRRRLLRPASVQAAPQDLAIRN
jgi:hypothetical protein